VTLEVVADVVSRRAGLLLLWVGSFALFRGISEIVIAFALRSRQHA